MGLKLGKLFQGTKSEKQDKMKDHFHNLPFLAI